MSEPRKQTGWIAIQAAMAAVSAAVAIAAALVSTSSIDVDRVQRLESYVATQAAQISRLQHAFDSMQSRPYVDRPWGHPGRVGTNPIGSSESVER